MEGEGEGIEEWGVENGMVMGWDPGMWNGDGVG